MKKTFKFPVLLILALLSARPAMLAASGGFQDTATGKELINLGLKFLDNPGDFFFNLHMDNADFSPVPTTKHGDFRWNFFPTTLPFSWVNGNLKVKLLNEKPFVPQIDVVGQYGDMLALHYLPSSDVKPTFKDYSGGLVFSKTVAEGTQFFWGGNISNISMDVKLSSSSQVKFGEFQMTQIKFDVRDTFVFAGLAHQKDPANPTRLAAQMGYGFTYKKVVSRVMISHAHYQWGIDIFPEGLFVLHPFMAWHWNF